MKASSILGLNARSQIYSYRYNTPQGRKIARSKILTKRILRKGGIPIPALYAKFRDPGEVFKFDWNTLPDSFALKPSKGLGGDGIIVVKRKIQASADGKSPPGWLTTKKEKVSVDDLKLHVLDILEGAYSVGNIPDVGFIEEYIGRHKSLQKFAFRGTPDIRVIVFNKVPVMAMLRLPTRESGGRANLHQGAIGVGVDIATGITTKAIWHGEPIVYKPDTKRKLHGIKVPQWEKILETAVQSQVVSHLGYLGVDIVLHPEKGPMVLEINSQPGLQIQLANDAGLKRRLERVDELLVKNAEHGVRIAKSLFAEWFADRVKTADSQKILRGIEEVTLYGFGDHAKEKVTVKARVDTGARRSSIDRNLATKLGLLDKKNILWSDRFQYRSATGLQTRPVVALKMRVAGKLLKTTASIADRSNLSLPVLIGRNDLTGFLVEAFENG
jgi:alpha-L-glutamate ligase-like protein